MIILICNYWLGRYLRGKIDVFTLNPVKNLIVEDNKIVGVKNQRGEEYFAEYVAVCPGREGRDWLSQASVSGKIIAQEILKVYEVIECQEQL